MLTGRSYDIGSHLLRTLLSAGCLRSPPTSSSAKSRTPRPGIPAAALADLPRERRVQLLVDHAIGEKQAGLRTAAVTTLLQAEEEALEEVRCRPRTKQLVEDLRLLGVGSVEERLRALADRCGLPR